MSPEISEGGIDLSIILPAIHQADRAAAFVPQIQYAANSLPIVYEIIIPYFDADDTSRASSGNHVVHWLGVPDRQYGTMLSAGFRKASGEYILTLELENTDYTALISDIWNARNSADCIIASRHADQGNAAFVDMRFALDKAINAALSRGLDLNVRDMTSGFRLYRSPLVKDLATESKGYDILQEILVTLLMEGYHIHEIPFAHSSNEKRYRFSDRLKAGLDYARTFFRLWRLRNSIASADYDARAYDAMMPPQRYWQRQRYKHIARLLEEKGRCLDIGCGSSRIIGALPPNSLALDILMRKVRFASRYERQVLQGSIFNLPFSDASFPCVLCSQVIEHVPSAYILDELDRVLQPHGFLILGTPDYDKVQWRMIEWIYKKLLPQAYADEHITHYTYDQLYNEFVVKRGYRLESAHYILQGELIMGLRKAPAIMAREPALQTKSCSSDPAGAN